MTLPADDSSTLHTGAPLLKKSDDPELAHIIQKGREWMQKHGCTLAPPGSSRQVHISVANSLEDLTTRSVELNLILDEYSVRYCDLAEAGRLPFPLRNRSVFYRASNWFGKRFFGTPPPVSERIWLEHERRQAIKGMA